MDIDGRFRLDNFVVGTANRLAVAAARAVAEAPGAVYNPLFIYSGSGLGKTHLLAGVGHLAKQLQPDLQVVFLTLDDFVAELHAAIASGEQDSFKKRYAHVDMLLLDDVQFLTGQRETQSEMLRMFTPLQREGRQVVMASDRPPAEISDVDERLLTRLAGGLVVDIGPPEYETRLAILQRKCEERELRFRTGVLEELASIEYQNIRELQGALNQIAAHQTLGGVSVGVQDVRALVGMRTPSPVGSEGFPKASGEFQSFVSDVAFAVAESVEPWKVRLGEAVAYWEGEGYRADVLERAMQLPEAPDVDGLIATFEAAIDHLRLLERHASGVDQALGANDVFRDPERVAEAEQLVDLALAGHTPPVGPSPAFARGSFEVGASNELAVRVADAVIAEPGKRYNPLFLHGPSGVGKTHLANAIGNELIELSGGAITVSCVSAQTFMDELVAAIQDGTVDRWRARYRSADALIIDDVQFIAARERTQEELFHIFNSFQDAGKQVILSSDRAPRELGALEDRLRSRFEGGLVVAMGSPDRVLREKLFARYLSPAIPHLDPALLEFLSSRPASSVREIIGLANRLMAAAELAGVPVTLEFAHTELDGRGSAPVPAPVADPKVDSFFFDDEKVVWDWPELAGRLIEEFR
jgi:chromosomal replication initiator protein